MEAVNVFLDDHDPADEPRFRVPLVPSLATVRLRTLARELAFATDRPNAGGRGRKEIRAEQMRLIRSSSTLGN
jgi:hypothetical protein